jgi:Domain of unknown function (DUF4286)
MSKIVYNITTRVRWDILQDWLAWQLEEQIPAVLATRLFDDHSLYRLLEQDEEEGPTFILQYSTSSLDRYQQFMMDFAPALQQKGWDRWGNAFIAFRTVMSALDADPEKI